MAAPKEQHREFSFPADAPERLANLCGATDAHVRQIERALPVVIANRGPIFRVTGKSAAIDQAVKILHALYEATESVTLTPDQVHLALTEQLGPEALGNSAPESHVPQDVSIRVKRGAIRGRGANQQKYLHQIVRHAISFGVGPAGTGKTYLAVASAVQALEDNQIHRILLVRPAVEAGEKLGFLPGDLSQKVDPYLRPLFDALYEMLGVERVGKLIERNVIEVAPLAYMRGRTLNDAFVILDEAQNTTVEQMKMFLTRLGFGSTAVITGDITQIDLPRHVRSGLKHAIEVLRNVDGISFTFFEARDVVRHPLVAKVIDAYDRHEQAAKAASAHE
ncbi:phosphate starvation-inducible protein PhoH [Ahniella affigens]|uniref:PhoH-like protein n=1 Tax=Ahniella affigens TaxID=2021234 RepID=A0A2P1PR78_9GAMM|nr:PhoH family protein [Ahniella affigens]AVP97350.1 phosphate starvation-inducible protein PhoH [Ahniella affigens]